jgi:hypothetical protein
LGLFFLREKKFFYKMDLRSRIAARFFQNQTLQEDEEMRSMIREMVAADGKHKQTVSYLKLLCNTMNQFTTSLFVVAKKPYVATTFETKEQSLQQQSLKLQITDGYLEGKNERLKEFTHMYLKQELEEMDHSLFANVCDFWSKKVFEIAVLLNPIEKEQEIEPAVEEAS